MSMRFLHIKRAYVTDPTYSFEVDRDAALNISLLDRVYQQEHIHVHDICAVTEEGEWLIHGRKIHPATVLQLYDIVFIYIHSPSTIYDRVQHACCAYAQKHVLIYKAMDEVLHHAERLEKLIKTNTIQSKIAHGIHVDMREHNEVYTSSQVVAGKHVRNIFLPVQVLASGYRTHTPDTHKSLIAHNFDELAQHIDALRHSNSHITLRSHIVGDSVFVASIPKLRGEKLYITMPSVSKNVHGRIHFQEAHLSVIQKKEVHQVVLSVAKLLFAKSPVVYTLRVHCKRGVFIQATAPFYFFILHNADFLFELACAHGIKVADLFESVL